MKRLPAFLVVFALACLPGVADSPHEGVSSPTPGAAIGKPAPDWIGPRWIDTDPLSLKDLVGKVVMVRWWTGPGCPYCRASSSWLNDWHEKYGSDGLVTVGFYHDKSTKRAGAGEVRRLAADLGFTFPVAIDPDWRTLRHWWLDGNTTAFTSVTFLLDKKGIVRLIHPGGSYSVEEATLIEAEITRLLAEE